MGWTLLSGMMPGSMKMLWVTDFRQYTVIARKNSFSVAEVLASSLTDSSFCAKTLAEGKCRTPSTAEHGLSGGAQ